MSTYDKRKTQVEVGFRMRAMRRRFNINVSGSVGHCAREARA